MQPVAVFDFIFIVCSILLPEEHVEHKSIRSTSFNVIGPLYAFSPLSYIGHQIQYISPVYRDRYQRLRNVIKRLYYL